MKNFDVVIVGAGPAGSATAISLARRGYEVALVDRKFFPREKLCGDFVNPANWPVFRDLGVEDSILAERHAEVTGFRITSYSGVEAEARFSSRGQQQSSGLGLRRAALDQVLVEKAAQLGVEVRFGHRIEKLARNSQGWQLNTGDEESWRAKILIGADGRNSWVAQQLGMSGRAAVHGRSVGFQSRFKCPGAVDGKVEIHLFPGGYAGVVGLGDGTITLGMAIDKWKLGRERGAEFLFNTLLAQNPHLKEIIQRSESAAELRSVYPVYFPKRRCFADGALLVGDAARVSEPVSGEGIYFAMRSGLLAAETVDQGLLEGDLSARFLRSYEQKCNSAFRSRLALNSLIRFAIYRPALLDPLIRLSAKNGRLLNSLIDAVCLPEAAR
jgi:geranylgeranyl reductase family protein